MTTSGTTNDNEWQRVVQRMTTNDNKWQRVTMNDNELQKMTMSNGMTAIDKTNEYEWE